MEHFRIDGTHSNAYAVWKSMSSPEHPSAEEQKPGRAAGCNCSCWIHHDGSRLRIARFSSTSHCPGGTFRTIRIGMVDLWVRPHSALDDLEIGFRDTPSYLEIQIVIPSEARNLQLLLKAPKPILGARSGRSESAMWLRMASQQSVQAQSARAKSIYPRRTSTRVSFTRNLSPRAAPCSP